MISIKCADNCPCAVSGHPNPIFEFEECCHDCSEYCDNKAVINPEICSIGSIPRWKLDIYFIEENPLDFRRRF